MSRPRAVELDGRSLTLDGVLAVARHGRQVRVREWKALVEGRRWLEEHVSAWRAGRQTAPIYGVSTGFGSYKNVRLEPGDVEAAQVNLIRSHALGPAPRPEDTFDDEVVRAATLLRINTFLHGRSGVRRELVEALVAMLNGHVHPRIPKRGSVGASGDLCPLAHFALVLIGEGEASVPEGDGRRVVGGREALAAVGLAPLTLSYKEGLALINGTTVSAACLALALADAEVLARTADVGCALGLEAIGGHARALDAKVHRSRGQAGQEDSAASLRAMTRGSSRLSTTDDKQDVYSFRCAPQVHGASRDALSHVHAVATAELLAVTDNPLFFVQPEDDEPLDLREFADNPARFGREPDRTLAYSAGNFHGQPVALAADILSMAVAELASISERRIAALVSPEFSRGLPPHLAVRPGLESGFMIAQYTAASLVSEAKVLAHPASVDSIPTGNGAEDHVSMSTWAARKAREIVELATSVVALELLVATQANEWRAVFPDARFAARPPEGERAERLREELDGLAPSAVAAELGRGSAAAYVRVRELSACLVEDRSLAADVDRVAAAVRSGAILQSVGEASIPLRRVRFE